MIEGNNTVSGLLNEKIYSKGQAGFSDKNLLKIETIFALKEWINKNLSNGDASGGQNIDMDIEINEVSESELAKISFLKSSNKVLALVKIPKQELSLKRLTKQLSFVLDGIQDPGNLGSIIRTAGWYGIDQIICSRDCVDVYNPKVIQATKGSIAHVPVTYYSIPELMRKLKSIPIYGAVLNGNDIRNERLTKTGLIVLGNEANGISGTVLKYVNRPITIHRIGSGESLNVSVTAAVIADHFRR
ncbi:MAG: RNA methyltransferase [Bacteroidetes bacterium]|nr:RNA methyltransferase [Bacteroidota bacterium]